MIPVLIGAALGVAAYKFLDDKERHDLALQEKTSTREISESEVPPEVLKKFVTRNVQDLKNFAACDKICADKKTILMAGRW